MAWSWRKRKTILPGVKINFGRKGISSTIGPRGASMTFGPNGTYLNTSIPGTGLYNRKKIGKNNMTNNMTNDTNFGCGSMLLTFVSGILWILLVILIFIAFIAHDFSYWWLGLIFTTIVIVSHLLMNAIFKSTNIDGKTSNPSTIIIPPIPTTSTIVGNDITEEYFKEIDILVTQLMGDYSEILKLKHIDQLLNSTGIVYRLNGKDVTDNASKLNILYWLDMTRCYLGLNNQIDLNDKSGWGLFDIIVKTLGGSIHNVSMIHVIRTQYQIKVENIVRCMKGYLETETISKDEFSVAKMLDNNSDLKNRYITHLYRFASVAAKSDNIVTDQEAEWLTNIIRQKDISCVNNNEEEPIEDTTPITTPYPKQVSCASAMNELKNLIGLASVKEEVETLTNFIKIQQTRAAKGIKTTTISYHCVFTGNPGTGKTTVARILAKIYKKLGVVKKGHLVETDRAGLVAEFVGQTAVKTNKIIDSALDGVLFIDEAYSLVQGGQSDYGKEAIATLLKRMEDDRERLIVIIAGYSKEMKDFIDANPGLQSRFNRYIEFPDYSAEDLLQIFVNQAKRCEYKITTETLNVLKAYFENQVAHKDKNFGNGRFARNIFEKTMELQANRLAREVSLTSEKLVEILPEDLPIQK